jgi:hypothetical protein
MMREPTHNGHHCLQCGRDVSFYIRMMALAPSKMYFRCRGCRLSLTHPAIPTWWSLLPFMVLYAPMFHLMPWLENQKNWSVWLVFFVCFWLWFEAVTRFWTWFLFWRWDWYHNEETVPSDRS